MIDNGASRRTALHEAAIDGTTEELAAALMACDINAVDVNGCTALWLAVSVKNVPAVRKLLESGADTEIADHYGNAPLWPATFRSRGDPTLVRLLLDYGADPDHCNLHGKSPRDLTTIIANYDLSQFFVDV